MLEAVTVMIVFASVFLVVIGLRGRAFDPVEERLRKKAITILVEANNLPRTPAVSEVFTPAFLPDAKDLPKKLF
jgi:hypothetical protein